MASRGDSFYTRTVNLFLQLLLHRSIISLVALALFFYFECQQYVDDTPRHGDVWTKGEWVSAVIFPSGNVFNATIYDSPTAQMAGVANTQLFNLDVHEVRFTENPFKLAKLIKE